MYIVFRLVVTISSFLKSIYGTLSVLLSIIYYIIFFFIVGCGFWRKWTCSMCSLQSIHKSIHEIHWTRKAFYLQHMWWVSFIFDVISTRLNLILRWVSLGFQRICHYTPAFLVMDSIHCFFVCFYTLSSSVSMLHASIPGFFGLVWFSSFYTLWSSGFDYSLTPGLSRQ